MHSLKVDLNIDDEDEFERIVSTLVDFVEFSAISQPLERVINHLLDQAQQSIIGNSVSKVVPGKHLQKLIQGVWLTNLQKDAGRETLDEAVAELPDARFLRSIMTSLLIYRVRWKLSSKTVAALSSRRRRGDC